VAQGKILAFSIGFRRRPYNKRKGVKGMRGGKGRKGKGKGGMRRKPLHFKMA